MSTFALLIVMLLVLVGLLFVGALAYAVYRRPALSQPLTVALAGAGVLTTLVTMIITTGTR